MSDQFLNLTGKKYLILGVANKKSIAWSMAEALKAAGAELAFTYVNEAIEKRLRPLAEEIGADLILPCDVQNDSEIDAAFAEIKEKWGKLDGVIHSVAFANREDMANRFSKTSRDGFALAMDVSAYSLIAVSNRAADLMTEGGTILTLSYLGAVRAIPNYNVMGVAKAALEASVRYLAADLGEQNIRVNAISAGPIKTLAASGIPGFKQLLNSFAEAAPLKRNTSLEDVAKTSLFYVSDLSQGVTGEVTYVDCGFSNVGVV